LCLEREEEKNRVPENFTGPIGSILVFLEICGILNIVLPINPSLLLKLG
jgi:hypothetical protein